MAPHSSTSRSRRLLRLRERFMRDRIPAEPQKVDPEGPEEYTWPRGRWNFGNVVLALSVLVVVTILVLTSLVQ